MGRKIVQAEGPGCVMHNTFVVSVIITYVILKTVLVILTVKTEDPGTLEICAKELRSKIR